MLVGTEVVNAAEPAMKNGHTAFTRHAQQLLLLLLLLLLLVLPSSQMILLPVSLPCTG